MSMKRLKLYVLPLLILGSLLFSIPARSDTWYVDASASSGGDGTSWATAFNNMQTAINAASGTWVICMAPPDQIWVREGVYTLTSQINLNKVVRIYGGFDGSETLLSERDWKNNPTILDGNNSVRVLNVTSYSEISGFTIRNGYTTFDVNGGGMSIDSPPVYCAMMSKYFSPRIRNCRFEDNNAPMGGAIYIYESDPEIIDCLFSSNSAQTGGAIYHSKSSPFIEKSIFDQNQSTAPGSLGGGAIGGYSRNFTTGALVTIENSLFTDNHANSWGGAISYHQVYPRIINSTFSGNSADILGGGFHGNTNSTGSLIRNSIFWGNTPDQLDIVTASSFLDVRYSDIQGGWTGPGINNIDADPDFVGPDDFHLSSTSPCIDTAANVYAPSDDLEGTVRPVDGDGDGTATSDMGAFEYAFVDLIVDSISTNPIEPEVGDPVDVDVTVRNQGSKAAGTFWMDWYSDLSSPPSTGQFGTEYEQVSSLGAGATHTMSTTYSYATAGNFNMYAQVDTDEDVAESNEGNNIRGPQIIHVVAPSPPVIDGTAVDGCISELCRSTLSVTAHDPAGGTLSYAWATLDGGAIIGSGASVLFDPPDAGPHPCPYRVKVTVTSSVSGLSTGQTINITVKLAGDVDGNGVVNVLDKLQVRNHFGESGAPGWIDADVNCDGFVNVLDKLKVRDQFGQSGCACP